MLSQIRQQLAQSWKDDLHRSVAAVAASPLNRQLSYQTEYNTSLLTQIEQLEIECQELRSALAAAESGRGDLQAGGRDAEQRLEDLHRKLAISAQLCDRLSQQCSELRDKNSRLESQNEENALELEAIRGKHLDILGNNACLASRVQELKQVVEHYEAGRSWEHNEENARAGALKDSVDKFTRELADSHARVASLEREVSLLAEENMEVQRDRSHAHSMLEAAEEEKRTLQATLMKVTAELRQLQIHTRQLEQDRKESIESQEIRQLELTYSDRAQHLAAEMSHRADEKWRQMEDLVRSRQRELAVASEDKERLERLVSNFEKKMRQAEERWQERERLIKADLTFQEEKAATREQSLKAELSKCKSVIASEQKRCEALSHSLISQQTEMTNQIADLRHQLDIKATESNAARDEAYASLQTLRRELETQTAREKHEALQRSSEVDRLTKKTEHLKEIIVTRGEKVVTTLDLLQAAVRQCVQEASEWKLRNSYLSSQLCKLLNVLSNLSVSHASADSVFAGMTPVAGRAGDQSFSRSHFDYTNLAEETVLESVPIALRPIRIYGDEIRKSFVMFAQRVSANAGVIEDLQKELKKTKLLLDENVFALDEERSELFATKKLLSNTKSQMSHLERTAEGKEREHRDELQMVEAARDAALNRAEKAEERTLDLTRQVTLLQAEITKSNAELKAVKTTYNLETNKLEEKIGQNEGLSESVKKEYQDLRRKYDEIVAENRKESEQRIRIREELKRCRDMAHDTASSFVAERDKLQEQVASMAKMLGHYEVQLKQKESLLEVIKSQRTELSVELKKLRAEITPEPSSSQKSFAGHPPASNGRFPRSDHVDSSMASLNALLPSTSLGHTFHASQDLSARDALSGYSNKLKHLTQSIEQMQPHFDSTMNMSSDSRNQSFRVPALDPEGAVDTSMFRMGASASTPSSIWRGPPSPTATDAS